MACAREDMRVPKGVIPGAAALMKEVRHVDAVEHGCAVFEGCERLHDAVQIPLRSVCIGVERVLQIRDRSPGAQPEDNTLGRSSVGVCAAIADEL